MDAQTSDPNPPHRAVVLLGKSAFSAAPLAETRRLVALLQARHPELHVAFGFSEQGTPSLRETLLTLQRPAFDDVLILPLLIPLETSVSHWLKAVVSRWQAEAPGAWPTIRIGRSLGANPLLRDLLECQPTGVGEPVPSAPPLVRGEGSIVPAQRRRVLVCQGPDCNMRGATVLWGHLRNVQERRRLRTAGDGTMTAMSTCLGPCNLAPVLQVFPEGTYYGGVTEAAIDRIADEHLLRGRIVGEFAYPADGCKHRLRQKNP